MKIAPPNIITDEMGDPWELTYMSSQYLSCSVKWGGHLDSSVFIMLGPYAL